MRADVGFAVVLVVEVVMTMVMTMTVQLRAFMSALVIGTLVVVALGADAAAAKTKTKPYIRPRPMMLPIPLEESVASGARASWEQRGQGDMQQGIQQGGAQALFTPGGAPLPVFINRNGGTYTAGADNSSQNRSSVVGSIGSANLRAFAGSNATWNTMMACIQDEFSRFNVTITDVEPTSGEYVEAVVGDRPQTVGLPNGVGGVAPIDNFQCNIIPRAVVYIFSDVLGNDAQLLCEVAAQEIAHAFSLDHEFLCQDPMTYLSGCGDKTFQDVNAQCGEFEPRQCNCGRATHNSVQLMTAKLGASGPVTPPDPSDTTPPVVSISSPAGGSTLPANSVIQVVASATDTGTVTSMELLWNFSGDIFACPTSAAGGAVTCTRNGNTATWSLNVGQGDRTFAVRATDGGGNVATTQNRTITLGDGTTPPPPNDDVPPQVAIVTPADNATLTANSTIVIEANATDDSGQLAAVELLWTFSGDAFPCPFSGQAVTCTQDGNGFHWELNVGVGTREFQVRATDVAGNAALTPIRTITLSTDPDAPVNPPPVGDDDVAEPNNDVASAFGVRCGSALDVVASPGDEDWFSIEAPADTAVEVGVSGAAGSLVALTLLDADGTTTLGTSADGFADSPITVTSNGPTVLARVTTSDATRVPYRLAVTCSAAGGDDPPVPDADDDLEENDSIADATRSFCGQERTALAAMDEDFFVVTVRSGDELTVESTTGTTAVIVDADGNELGADGSALNLPEGDVYVRVVPSDGPVTYDVSFACNAPAGGSAAQGCGGCSTTSSTAFLPALIGLLLLRRRRR